MDDSVLAGLARWPDVPHVYGWLSLDRRGRWLLQDSPVSNPGINAFIGRNYAHDERGAWFFQNGPQRVHARLDYTPWILHVGAGHALTTHTGLVVRTPDSAWLDEQGNLLIGGEHGIGLVIDRDLATLLDAIRGGAGNAVEAPELERVMAGEQLPLQLRWHDLRLPLLPLRSDSVAERFGFISDPQAT